MEYGESDAVDEYEREHRTDDRPGHEIEYDDGTEYDAANEYDIVETDETEFDREAAYEGTVFDPVSTDDTVIVDGKATRYEEYRQTRATSD